MPVCWAMRGSYTFSTLARPGDEANRRVTARANQFIHSQAGSSTPFFLLCGMTVDSFEEAFAALKAACTGPCR
jgi:hypothetical protein